MVQPWRVYIVRYFTTENLDRALRYILAAGAVKFRGMPFCFFLKGIHSIRRQLRHLAMQGLARRVNSLTQPLVHWQFFLLFSFWLLSYVYTVEHGHSSPIQLPPGATFMEVANFLDHRGFGDIVATFCRSFEESEWQFCRERAHGPNKARIPASELLTPSSGRGSEVPLLSVRVGW